MISSNLYLKRRIIIFLGYVDIGYVICDSKWSSLCKTKSPIGSKKIKDLVSADQVTSSTRTSNQEKERFREFKVLLKEGSDVRMFIFHQLYHFM